MTSEDPSISRARALLTMADYGGTLAATRLLGRKGIEVIIAESRRWVPARFSRFVSSQVDCPEPRDWEAYLSWLLEYGRTKPGIFLYPTSDDTAWLYAQHARLLERHFILWQPPVEVIYNLLNKKVLSEVCAEVGIATPRTYFPQSEASCRQIASQMKRPYLLKPRTQIGLRLGHKGQLVLENQDDWTSYAAFQSKLIYQPQLLASDPEVSWPMMQEYYPAAMQSIVSVAGFVDAQGSIVARSSRKVLQRPRRLGVGLCFASIPLDPGLVALLEKLCRRLGYFGVFEAEFIEDAASGGPLLIDFNPRYYGQMGFEIARGLPLPWLAWLAAQGDHLQLNAALAEARQVDAEKLYTYSTRWLLYLSLGLGFLAGKHSWKELLYWRRWLADPQHAYADAIYDAGDPRPFWVEILLHAGRYMRHPRDFFRKFFLDT